MGGGRMLELAQPSTLEAVHDQCGQVEAWARECDSIPQLKDMTGRLAAIDEYLSHTSREGRARVAECVNRLEARIGELLGPAPGTGNPEGPHADLIPKQRRAEFRVMASDPGAIDAVAERSTDDDPPSRRKVVREVKARRNFGQPSPDRHPMDSYATDPRWTRVLLDRVGLEGPVWEPAAGDGAIVTVLQDYGYEVSATDLVTGDDFLESNQRAGSIVTNPPYKLVDEFIRHGLQQTDRWLCLLLGWHLIPGGARRLDEVWCPYPPALVLAVAERMKVNGESSQFNHAWVVWDTAASIEATVLEWAHATTV